MFPAHDQIFSELRQHHYLLRQLIKRDVLLRYRGAMFGVIWVFLSPLFMLGIFAFIFGEIFQTRWPHQGNSVPFWILLYAGLIVFNIFSETAGRAPMAVRAYPTYVKKIIFPVGLLPVVSFGAALVHAGFNFVVLLGALLLTGHFSLQILLLPVCALPVMCFALGFSWFVAAWGVFIKDMVQIVPVFVQMLLFLSPVFYPVSAVPPMIRPIYQYNPLSAAIEASRGLITGAPMAWEGWLISLGIGILVMILAYTFFERSREEFPDVM